MASWTMKWMAGLVALGLSVPALADELTRREVRQQERIAQGARSGELTGRETARLERRDAHVEAKVARDRVDGGGLTPAERARDNAMLNRTSRAIYRQKHDAQRR